MKRLVAFATATSLVAAFGATSCGGVCDTICDKIEACDPDFFDDDFRGCDWDGDPADIADKCRDECESEYDRLSDSEVETVDRCVECMDEEIGDSCSEEAWAEAGDEECENECQEEEDWRDFTKDLFDDLDLEDEVDC